MDNQTIVLEAQDGITTITLNRPQRYNALNVQMIKELMVVLESARRGDGARVIVLTGAGRGFSGGADLKDPDGPAGLVPDDSAESKRQGLRLGFYPLIHALHSSQVPVKRNLTRGAPRVKLDMARLVERTTQSQPEAATHWSTRKMAAVLHSSGPRARATSCRRSFGPTPG